MGLTLAGLAAQQPLNIYKEIKWQKNFQRTESKSSYKLRHNRTCLQYENPVKERKEKAVSKSMRF